MDICFNNFHINISTSTVFFCIPPKFLEHIIPHPFVNNGGNGPRLQQQLAGLAAEPLNEAVELEVPKGWMDGRHARVGAFVSGGRITPPDPQRKKKKHGYALGRCQNPGGTKWVTSLHPENYNLEPPLKITHATPWKGKNPSEPSTVPPSLGNKNILIFQGVDPGSVLF